MKRFLLVIMVLWWLPSVSEAALIINEIAWMGNANSANDEWIELYNTGGATVSVDGWTLTDGAGLSIALAGAVGAGQYAVLERTDDSSAPGTAFVIYTGALSNTGATLRLLDAGGALQDQVAGGENWENIGGDNTTKETAQYTTSGWLTGSPTPGKSNVSAATISDVPDDDSDEGESSLAAVTSSSKQGSSESIQMELADKTLELTLTAPTLGYVNQPVAFSVESDGLTDGLLHSLGYRWNFGDLSIGSGESVVHQYAYPGTYVVMLTGAYARHEATVRHEITILPVAFSLTRNQAGDLQINNDSKYEIDLSGYAVRGKKTILFPEGTILLPKNTLTIPKQRLGDTAVMTLFDQAQTIVASTMPTNARLTNVSPRPVVAMAQPSPPPAASRAPAAQQTDFSFASEETEVEPVMAPAVVQSVEDTNVATVNQAATPVSSQQLPLLGLLGVLSIGVLGLLAGRVRE